ncbi:tetratricopeptide repeat protein [Ktedonobacteria bacterium brp13]|nr:tetratricopeptide repeat protein [Ktedonobacteria bacterium brp13]
MDTPNPQDSQIPSQYLGQMKKSAIANTGNAYNYNIEGGLHQHYPTPSTPWIPPQMLPLRAQSFVGREEDLAWLLQHMKNGTAGTTLAICGPGGMGKTALAAEALHQLIDQEDGLVRFPDGVFYHSFYASPSLSIVFEELARVFGEQSVGDPRRVTLRALSRRRALLVFDGVEVLENTLPLWELGGRNVVIVISRRQSDAPNLAHYLDLQLLSLEQGIALVQKIAQSRAADRESVASLVQAIGGYPLALQLIGSYLASRGEEVTEYLEQFEADRLHVLEQPELSQGEHQYLSVQLVLQHTYDSLSSREQQLLALTGMFALAPFPQELVQPILNLPMHQVRQALGALVNLSLLRRPEQSYEVSHPLVHTFAMKHLSSQGNDTSSSEATLITTWQKRFLSTLATHFKQNDPYDQIALALWQPHVLHLLTANYLTTEQLPRAAHLFNEVGIDTTKQGKYAEAEPLYLRALAIYEQQLGSDHPNTASSLNNLATLYRTQGKYAEAEPLLKRALTIREQQLRSDHPDTATNLNNLAGLYYEQGKYAEAEPLYLRALAIREQQLGTDHPDTATSLNNLAALYHAQGKYVEAEPLYLRALAIREQQRGTDHPDTATSLNNLADLYRTQSKYAEAEPLLKRALAIREQQLEALHPDTATSLNNLAALYRTQGKYAEAEPLLKRALAIREQQLGSDHPDTATSFNNLAQLYHAQGKYAEAEPLLKRALAIYEQQLGPDHPDTATSLNDLAQLNHAQGKYAEAEPLLKRALAIYEQQLGPDHPDTATSLNNLATLYHMQSKYVEAELLFQRALTIREQQLGATHPDTATSLNNLAALYYEQSKFAEAEPLLKRALAIYDQQWGATHPITQNVYKNYVTLLKILEHDTN